MELFRLQGLQIGCLGRIARRSHNNVTPCQKLLDHFETDTPRGPSHKVCCLASVHHCPECALLVSTALYERGLAKYAIATAHGDRDIKVREK